jgi:hypothetical protein
MVEGMTWREWFVVVAIIIAVAVMLPDSFLSIADPAFWLGGAIVLLGVSRLPFRNNVQG